MDKEEGKFEQGSNAKKESRQKKKLTAQEKAAAKKRALEGKARRKAYRKEISKTGDLQPWESTAAQQELITSICSLFKKNFRNKFEIEF